MPQQTTLEELESAEEGFDRILGDDTDLDALLNESVKYQKDAQAVKDARKLLAGKGLEVEARKNIQASIQAWELKREWRPVADVAMFHAQHCSHCGSVQTHYSGLFQRQSHRESRIDRWIKSDPTANAGLPKESKEDMSFVSMCQGCCGEFGWAPPSHWPPKYTNKPLHKESTKCPE